MKTTVLLLSGLMMTLMVYGQQLDDKPVEKEQNPIFRLLEEKSFRFSAERVNPTRGRSLSISSHYLQVKGTAVDSDLPYFGRAYTAEIGSSGSPYSFSAELENYSLETTKKGYQVKFKVRQGADVINYIFQVSENGSAMLTVSSSRRETISYTGNLAAISE